MEKEKIERAAIELCTTEGQEEWVKDYGVSCFKDGARWRIDSAWHYDLGKAETGRQFLVEFKNGRVGMFDDIWVIKGMGDLVARYAYVSDLLPERKEVRND